MLTSTAHGVTMFVRYDIGARVASEVGDASTRFESAGPMGTSRSIGGPQHDDPADAAYP